MNPQNYNDVDIDYNFGVNNFDIIQEEIAVDEEKELSINEELTYDDKLTTTIEDVNNMKPTREIIRGSVINE